MAIRHLNRVLLTITALLVIGVFVASILILSSKSVLFRTPFVADSHCGGSAITLFNPFRNREPEIAADEFLNLLKAGQCDRAVQDLPSELKTPRCLKEKEYPLSSWRLKDRDEGDQKVTLAYCYKSQASESEERLWLILEKKGSWTTINFWRVY